MELINPLRVGIAGLVHGHVHKILSRKKKDVIIAGIAEPNRELAEAFANEHGFSMDIVFSTPEEMIANTKPEAVLAFNPIYDHLKTVEVCAPHGIHVMVEKPLAVSLEHAKQMIALAEKHRIHLLTNYETTWYGSTKAAWEMINEKKEIGSIGKMVFHTGHPGPIEIGCNPEFLQWLTDPVLNGGGALMDFGCYGANIATWLLQGELPVAVTAVTRQANPDKYPLVEDEATITLTYKHSTVIIEASWNMKTKSKDMEVYGAEGNIFCLDAVNMQINHDHKQSKAIEAAPLKEDREDAYSYFANVIRGKIRVEGYDLSGVANNKIVMQILEAAKHSAKTGTTVVWDTFFDQDRT